MELYFLRDQQFNAKGTGALLVNEPYCPVVEKLLNPSQNRRKIPQRGQLTTTADNLAIKTRYIRGTKGPAPHCSEYSVHFERRFREKSGDVLPCAPSQERLPPTQRRGHNRGHPNVIPRHTAVLPPELSQSTTTFNPKLVEQARRPPMKQVNYCTREYVS